MKALVLMGRATERWQGMNRNEESLVEGVVVSKKGVLNETLQNE
jgi:hypothetical protein